MPPNHGTCVFIDENLASNIVGIYSVVWPPSIQQIIQRIREKNKLYDEIKWTTTSRVKIPTYKELIECFFGNQNWGRLSLIKVTRSVDSAILHGLRKMRRHCESYNGIFIDNHSTPRGYNFERQLGDEFGCRCVMRLDSKTNDLLQLCDLLMNLNIKSEDPESVQSQPKKEVLNTFISNLESAAPGRFFWIS